mgnify:CR=1 FL=1
MLIRLEFSLHLRNALTFHDGPNERVSVDVQVYLAVPHADLLRLGLWQDRVRRILIEHRDDPPNVLRDYIVDAASMEIPKLERFLSALGTVANISTLLGLLGTVTGMIRSFLALRLSGVADPAVLAGGISEALITTAAGLLVAIPCLVTYHVLTQAVDRITARVETAATELQLFYAQRGSRR